MAADAPFDDATLKERLRAAPRVTSPTPKLLRIDRALVAPRTPADSRDHHPDPGLAILGNLSDTNSPFRDAVFKVEPLAQDSRNEFWQSVFG